MSHAARPAPKDQGSDNGAQVVDGEFFALDTALNQFGEEIVAGRPASVCNHDVDVRLQLVESFRIRRLGGPSSEQVPVFARHAQSRTNAGDRIAARSSRWFGGGHIALLTGRNDSDYPARGHRDHPP
jgi:hypothetical protein